MRSHAVNAQPEWVKIQNHTRAVRRRRRRVKTAARVRNAKTNVTETSLHAVQTRDNCAHTRADVTRRNIRPGISCTAYTHIIIRTSDMYDVCAFVCVGISTRSSHKASLSSSPTCVVRLAKCVLRVDNFQFFFLSQPTLSLPLRLSLVPKVCE